ncbi:MAG: hypothetical protein A3E21_07420 [Sulfurimonas sp. RIFCSPHIGHO2_12_FULL_36_9]|uniref:hypothetical protein n=1 Tax=Sulfurimonas sp. RIFCSPLOWO2_12_36_12 TaxID=1802253 RepID=UPI0008BACDF0|nr:hypothetical protein [Sulfurimonas sp. RIFCSPLOWO2_12_36_12]OHD96448.1 MAG: hypothetical protein A3E21_07420 [Sulfurimonas sp. RIFCSPHIGHO2_12_FULL_36_9]OHD99564.1 MAG: hypothetical protein A3J26_03155 [Sulfurimonas sp. RIFCSPLOWO2_02_FULL_36_28]OHE02399.1 MAG: hypothetical protein A2W82_10170 [Sulfurimonas sp. RIFCSPLOWO2_12_36_12]OHE07656.1 MAG: hypothetical protein A3K14_02305 [Sulfurimonas sp. RIFCSPLOWO2_12_FULL_36_74]
MLPVILGGVALAAVGYGIKKYCEDEKCFLDEDMHYSFVDVSKKATSETDICEELNHVKLLLHKTTIRETEYALAEINNLPSEVRPPMKEPNSDGELTHIEPTEENQKTIQMFCDILLKAKDVQDVFLQELDVVLIQSSDYSEFTADEKEKVHTVLILYKTIQEAMQLPMTFDDVTINRTVKRAFERLNILVDN